MPVKPVGPESAFQLALEIQEILEAVDQRCMAADGPVTPTKDEITSAELRRIYVASLKIKAVLSEPAESRKRNG